MRAFQGAAICACAVGIAMPLADAWAGKVTTLYSFQGGTDGQAPYAGVIAVGGTLYGTTERGGTAKYGTVFAVDIGSGQETVLHSFTGGADGAEPYGGLIYQDGKLYGTTSGGNSGLGTIFSIDPAKGTETVVYSFKGTPDGANPLAGLLYRDGQFYGTTQQGGSRNSGTLFRFNPRTGKEQVVWNFGATPQDGSWPEAGLTAIRGNLYGTTLKGGSGGDDGVLFSFDPHTGTETVLHAFTGGNDGAGPMAAPGVHGGILFGTTSCYPQAPQSCLQVLGTAYSYDLATGAYAVMYDFQGQGATDSEYPQSTPVYHGGWVYGTASGGNWNGGTIFKINTVTHAQKSLYTFSSNSYPFAGLLPLNGAYYGTTATGGASGNGSVFEFIP